MHPSPNHLITMSNAELEAYREELRELDMERGTDPFSAYRSRIDLIDAIISDRKRMCPRSDDGAHRADGSGAHCLYCNAPMAR